MTTYRLFYRDEITVELEVTRKSSSLARLLTGPVSLLKRGVDGIEEIRVKVSPNIVYTDTDTFIHNNAQFIIGKSVKV